MSYRKPRPLKLPTPDKMSPELRAYKEMRLLQARVQAHIRTLDSLGRQLHEAVIERTYFPKGF